MAQEPPPAWSFPTFMGQFADPYVEGTELEGSDVGAGLAVTGYLIHRLVRGKPGAAPGTVPTKLPLFQQTDLVKVSCAAAVLRDASEIWCARLGLACSCVIGCAALPCVPLLALSLTLRPTPLLLFPP